MKITHVFKDYYPPTTGGIEQHINLLCRGLARHHQVSVLVPSRSRQTVAEQLDGVAVVRAAEFLRVASVPVCPTLPGHLRRLRPDLVHLHFPNPLGDVAYLLAARHAPLVVTYHADIVRQRALLPLYRPLLQAVLSRASRIIVGSAEYLESSDVLRRHRARCVVVPYGIDVDALALTADDHARVRDVRARHGGRLVLFVGVLRYYKGIEVLLRAMAKVAGHLVVVGRGTKRDALGRAAERAGVADRVTFAGELASPALRVLLHACDVFVLPSLDRSESFGIAQLEAMACGKPVVSSDLPTGVRFVNQHGVTGLLCPPGDAAALADALNRLLGDPALLARFGEAARRRVTEQFTVERMVARTLDVYESVRSGR
jgi:glycosyltransferase involved in cell wall biosynthesis